GVLSVAVTQVPQASQGSLSYSLDGGGTAVVTTTTVMSVTELASVSFTSAPNYNGAVDTFTYTVSDDEGDASASDAGSLGAVLITINAINDAPIAINDGLVAVTEDTPATGNVLTNDSDPDGDAIEVLEFTVPGVAGTIPAGSTAFISGVGTLVIETNGDFTFTPIGEYNGPIPTATYTITDNVTGTATAELAFEDVTPTNDAPEAIENTYVTPEEVLIAGNVIVDNTGSGVDNDIDGDGLSVSTFTIAGQAGLFAAGTPVTIPNVGALTLESDGSFTFLAVLDFNGMVPAISYTVTDGNGGSDTALLNIEVTPINDAPSATTVPATTLEDQTVNGDVVMSDVDGDTPLASLSAPAANGVAFISPNGTWSYTPFADFHGTDTFDVLVDDQNGGTTTVTVSIVVTPVVDIADDSIEVTEDIPLTVNVITGLDTVGGTTGAGVDSFEGSPIITNVTQGTNGSVTFAANGEVVYTPDPDYNGPDTFTYTVISGGQTETATVNVNVLPANDAPTGVAPPAITQEEVPVSGVVTMSDPDGDPTTASLADDPTNGTVIVNPDGTWTYTPNVDFDGLDTFTVTIDDGNGGTATVLVEVTVLDINDAPDATSSSVQAVQNNPTPLNITLPTDVDDVQADLKSIIMQGPSSTQGSLSYVQDTGGSAIPLTTGTILSNTELSTVLFTATPGYLGAVNPLVFATSDDDNFSDAGSIATISIEVVDAPLVTQASEPPQITPEDVPINGQIDILATYPTTTTITVPTDNGTVIIVDPTTGEYIYTPNPNYNGPDQFTVLVVDGINPDVVVVVDITVTPVDDPTSVVDPVVPIELIDGGIPSIPIPPLFIDIDSPLTYTVIGLPPGLVFDPVTNIIGGQLPPNASQTGPYTVTVTATDGVNPPVSVVLEIEVLNPAPIAPATIDRPVNEGDLITIELPGLVNDPDGDVLSWTSPDLPAWITLDPVTGVLSGVAPEDSAVDGPVSFTVIVDDGEGGVSSILVTITPIAPSDALPDRHIGAVQENVIENHDLPEEEKAPVVPFIVNAVEQIQDLKSTKPVDGVKGIIHDTVNNVEDMKSTENAELEDPAVLEAVEAINALRKVHEENEIVSRNVFEDWDVEGLTGFSLKFGYGDGFETEHSRGDEVLGQLVIETYVRERILFIDVSNTFDPQTQGIVRAYHVEMADGSAIPDWIRIVRDGFIVVERPANLWDLELRIFAEMEDGSVISRGVAIDGPTGEIQPLKLSDNAGSRLFEDQLQDLAKSDSRVIYDKNRSTK
ncbi:MAG: tandem-95 repeat protein, partial [Rhizobiaceae bacterium]